MSRPSSLKKRFQGKAVHTEPHETYVSTHITHKNEYVATLQPKASSSTAGYLGSLSSSGGTSVEYRVAETGCYEEEEEGEKEDAWPALDEGEPEPVCLPNPSCFS
jgi:hypothetical protein